MFHTAAFETEKATLAHRWARRQHSQHRFRTAATGGRQETAALHVCFRRISAICVSAERQRAHIGITFPLRLRTVSCTTSGGAKGSRDSTAFPNSAVRSGACTISKKYVLRKKSSMGVNQYGATGVFDYKNSLFIVLGCAKAISLVVPLECTYQ